MLENRHSAEVVQELLDEMARLIVSYPEDTTPTPTMVQDLIAGTAFFPGGTGLWRGQEAGGSLPQFFPHGPVMLVGRDFGDLDCFEQAKRDRGEAHKAFAGLWNNLLDFLAHSGPLAPSDCFFTNAYMGLRRSGRSGKAPTNATFEAQCAEFLASQAHITQSRAVVLLGDNAYALWRRACKTNSSLRIIPAKKIMHPSARPLNQQPSPDIWRRDQGRAIATLLAANHRTKTQSTL